MEKYRRKEVSNKCHSFSIEKIVVKHYINCSDVNLYEIDTHTLSSSIASTFSFLYHSSMVIDDILQTIKKHIPDLMNLSLQKIGVFGSVTRYTASSANEIDILITFSPGKKTFDNYMDANFFLKSEDIDLVIEESLRDRLKPYIYKDLTYSS